MWVSLFHWKEGSSETIPPPYVHFCKIEYNRQNLKAVTEPIHRFCLMPNCGSSFKCAQDANDPQTAQRKNSNRVGSFVVFAIAYQLTTIIIDRHLWLRGGIHSFRSRWNYISIFSDVNPQSKRISHLFYHIEQHWIIYFSHLIDNPSQQFFLTIIREKKN